MILAGENWNPVVALKASINLSTAVILGEIIFRRRVLLSDRDTNDTIGNNEGRLGFFNA